MKLGSWTEVNLNNIGHNLKEIKQTLDKDTKTCCVIKANAYGCGAIEVARYLEKQNIDFLAVARIEEALELRNNDISLPILCLGYTDISMVEAAIKNNIAITVYNLDYAKKVDRLAETLKMKAILHIKIDSGMNRLGLQPKESIGVIEEINKLKNITLEGIFTHFAKADEEDKSVTISQLDSFKWVINKLEEKNINIEIKHVANSAAILDLNEYKFNMVRIGIALYGYYPSNEINKTIKLKPCVKLKSVVTNVKVVDKDTGISYGHTYKTTNKSKIITISIGYADGFNRVQENPKVHINGKILNIVGRICMDQCMAEAPLDFDVQVGDVVTLIDNNIKELTAEVNADRNNTINYEILCMIGRRVTRVYTENGLEYKKNYLLDK